MDVERIRAIRMSEQHVRKVEAAVARNVVAEDPATHDEAVRRQMDLYYAATPERRAILASRLLTIDEHLSGRDRTARDVAAAGVMLGLGQSGMYRLLKRMADHGPVAGLLPGHVVGPRSGVTRGGFGDPVDAWIAASMRTDPAVKVSQVLSTLRSKAAMMEPGKQPTIPAQTALRRRIQHLRSSGAAGAEIDRPVGGDILVAHCAIELWLYSATGTEAEFAPAERPSRDGPASIVVIVDERTSLVLASAIYVDGDARAGLEEAVGTASRLLVSIMAAGGSLVPGPSRIRWTVLPATTDFARRALLKAESGNAGVAYTMVAGRDAENGREAYRHLGELAPPFRLLPRLHPDGMSDGKGASRKLPVSTELLTLGSANLASFHRLEERNRRIIGVKDLRGPVGTATPDQRRAAEDYARSLRRLLLADPE